MDINYIIRQAEASPQDARAIQHIEYIALGDSLYGWEFMFDSLRLEGHYTYLALVGNEPAGFCSCLETPVPDGLQLEIDLLGVLPQFRNHGIATDLIRSVCLAAGQRQIHHFRAVVADDNAPSQHAFARAGLRRSDHPYELLVYHLHGRSPVDLRPVDTVLKVLPNIDGSRIQAPGIPLHFSLELDSAALATAESLLVRTVTYTGIWFERLQGQEEWLVQMVRKVLAWAAEMKLDEVGIHCTEMACPEVGQVEALWRAGFETQGRFYTYS